MDDVAPLKPLEWFNAVGKLAIESRTASGDDVDLYLRRAYYLAKLAPRALRELVRSELPEERFEALLDSGGPEAAALSFVGTPVSFTIRQAGAGEFEANVALPDQTEPSVVKSPILAAAILNAWLECLVALGKRAITPRTGNARLARSKARSGPRLRLIER